MELRKAQPNSAVTTAMVCAGAVGAQFIAGKATRDALFLKNLGVTALPLMVMATAVVSIALVALSSRALRRISPGAFISAAFALSAALFLLDWVLVPIAPELAAQALYFQVSGLGPMLGSGFWLITTENFDPHTARRTFGRIAATGTLSGLVGAVLADRVASIFGATAMLPVLAGLNVICAWQIRSLAVFATKPRHDEIDDAVQAGSLLDGTAHLSATSPVTGLRALAGVPYLQTLAAFVLLSTLGATLADYVFKVQAVETFGRDDTFQFFAMYYGATTVIAFFVQTFTGARALERLGLAVTTSTPPLALCVGGLGALAVPGLPSMLFARGAESVFRGSLFRTGYEIFYTPVPPSEKRAAKSAIDVGFDRLGDALGGGIVRLLLLLPAASQYGMMLGVSVGAGALALVVARQLNRGYIQTLERSLVNRAVELDLSNVEDLTTRTALMKTLNFSTTMSVKTFDSRVEPGAPGSTNDPEIQNILTLRSRNREQIIRVLREDQAVTAAVVPHVLPLLAWDAVAEEAVRALRKTAEERLGALTDALLDPNQPFAVRRRLARVFSICVSQRAVEALLLGLDDTRFEVRFQCGRSLSAIVSKNRLVRVDRERVFEVVRREVAVGRPVWQSHRLLDAMPDDKQSFVDEFIKDRAGQSLAHVFVLLSLVLPTTPLQIAYRGLHTNDPALRGTALEYLEGVLPPDIRERLWPFLGPSAPVEVGARGRDEILADLLRSNDSIVLNLKELRRRGGTGN
jgi:ATP:ADP antiporter, AAA family